MELDKNCYDQTKTMNDKMIKDIESDKECATVMIDRKRKRKRRKRVSKQDIQCYRDSNSSDDSNNITFIKNNDLLNTVNSNEHMLGLLAGLLKLSNQNLEQKSGISTITCQDNSNESLATEATNLSNTDTQDLSQHKLNYYQQCFANSMQTDITSHYTESIENGDSDVKSDYSSKTNSLKLFELNSDNRNINLEATAKYLTKFNNFSECKFPKCILQNLGEHYHCNDMFCQDRIFCKKDEIFRHLKWHKKRLESLNYGFLRFSAYDDCAKQYGPNCPHNRRQTHYHCIHTDCAKCYVSTSDVQMHANYHRKDSAIYQEGFQRFRAHEDCNGAGYCSFANQKTTHFHCRRNNCRYTFKNKSDMDKHKTYHMKDLQLARDGFKKYMRTEACPFDQCRFSLVCNHIHCVRENCYYVLHSSGQLISHKRKHERLDSEAYYKRLKNTTNDQIPESPTEDKETPEHMTTSLADDAVVNSLTVANLIKTYFTDICTNSDCGTEVSHLHCLINGCNAVVLFESSQITNHIKIHENELLKYSPKHHDITESSSPMPSTSSSYLKTSSNTMQITSIDGFFNRKRGRPPKNRIVELYSSPSVKNKLNQPLSESMNQQCSSLFNSENTFTSNMPGVSQISPEAIFTSFKLEKKSYENIKPQTIVDESETNLHEWDTINKKDSENHVVKATGTFFPSPSELLEQEHRELEKSNTRDSISEIGKNSHTSPSNHTRNFEPTVLDPSEQLTASFLAYHQFQTQMALYQRQYEQLLMQQANMIPLAGGTTGKFSELEFIMKLQLAAVAAAAAANQLPMVDKLPAVTDENPTSMKKVVHISGNKLQKMSDEPVPPGYTKFRFNEDCEVMNCNYRNQQSHFHCSRPDCGYSFCDKTRFVQHTARHERLDKLMGSDFKQYRSNLPCPYDNCHHSNIDLRLNLIGSANKSSHFHCLKCDFVCTDTNKVVAHRRQHNKTEFLRLAGFRKVGNNEICDLNANDDIDEPSSEASETTKCVYEMKQMHYHCLTCNLPVLNRGQLNSHQHR